MGSHRLSALVATLLYVAGSVMSLDVAKECACGYVDPSSQKRFTDSIIVYFNETTEVPTSAFLAESYRNKYEQGWNSQFRQGADPANVRFDNSTSDSSTATSSLQLVLNAATEDHTCVGGGIRTLRQDILYGSFRASMKSPGPWAGGSSLSMMLQYNQTQAIKMGLQNANNKSEAWMSTLLNHEFPNRYLGVNYTALSNASLPYGIADPWDYNELRVDWLPKNISFLIGGKVARVVPALADDGTERPNTPSPFTLKHWSVGDPYLMRGPPMRKDSKANVAWLRLFFNSSSMADDARTAFDSRCAANQACSTEDMTLRGSTPFEPNATAFWSPPDSAYKLRWPAVGIGSFGLSITIVVTLNVILRRLLLPSEKPSAHKPAESETEESHSSNESLTSGGTTPLAFHRSPMMSGIGTPLTGVAMTIRGDGSDPPSGAPTTVPPSPFNLTRPPSVRDDEIRPFDFYKGHPAEVSHKGVPMTPGSATPLSPPAGPFSPGASQRHTSFLGRSVEGMTYGPALPLGDSNKEEVTQNRSQDGTLKDVAVTAPSAPAAPSGSAAPVAASAPTAPVRQRVDYLAGLVAACSMLVSLTHFMLTFLPATIVPGAFAHYPSEVWATKTIGPFLFNEVWVVMFFTTSTRFLTTKYLRSGDLSGIAEKVVGRVFRLMVPITGIILLEYFLMDVGAINWLQYLPSVSWSTWPYTRVYANFGSFISETMELVFLIPNAMPQITFNFCTGVLWTIPVQIQGSWQAMLGVIVVKEIKTPWKRFGYYTFCIINHWYARSWGSFFMGGLLLADLDITFKYKKWLYARPAVYYPLLNLAILLTLLGLGNDLISAWTGFNLQTLEHGWHPDQDSGVPIQDTDRAGFPPYYTPKLNGLIFALCSQLVVEWSTVVQKAISTPVFLWLFPHIFTIYLWHGFVFWSVGSWICIGMESWGTPYWLNMLVTAIGSFGFMFASLPIITPVVEALGKSVTQSIWQSASEKPPPKRSTLYPFPNDLFTSRGKDESSTSSIASGSTTDVEIGSKREVYVVVTER